MKAPPMSLQIEKERGKGGPWRLGWGKKRRLSEEEIETFIEELQRKTMFVSHFKPGISSVIKANWRWILQTSRRNKGSAGKRTARGQHKL